MVRLYGIRTWGIAVLASVLAAVLHYDMDTRRTVCFLKEFCLFVLLTV